MANGLQSLHPSRLQLPTRPLFPGSLVRSNRSSLSAAQDHTASLVSQNIQLCPTFWSHTYCELFRKNSLIETCVRIKGVASTHAFSVHEAC